MSKQVDSFQLNTYELPRRAGEMKEYELDIEAPSRIGVPLIGVPEGDVIEADIRVESVTATGVGGARVIAFNATADHIVVAPAARKTRLK